MNVDGLVLIYNFRGTDVTSASAPKLILDRYENKTKKENKRKKENKQWNQKNITKKKNKKTKQNKRQQKK